MMVFILVLVFASNNDLLFIIAFVPAYAVAAAVCTCEPTGCTLVAEAVE